MLTHLITSWHKWNEQRRLKAWRRMVRSKTAELHTIIAKVELSRTLLSEAQSQFTDWYTEALRPRSGHKDDHPYPLPYEHEALVEMRSRIGELKDQLDGLRATLHTVDPHWRGWK